MAKRTEENRQSVALSKRLHSFYSVFSSLKEPIFTFIGFRLAIGMLPFFAWVLFPTIAPQSRSGYILPNLNFWGERLLGVWSHWDGEWFLKIAEQGYRADDDTLAFFPLYPILVKVFGFLTGGNYLLAATLISGGVALAVFVLMYELVRRDFGTETTSRALLYLAFFPTAFYLSAAYSEGLFLALTLGAFLEARHNRNFWRAGILAGLAALTRNLGVVLILPLAWEWWRQWREGRQGFKDLLPLIFPPLALASWLAYVGANFGNPFLIFQVQTNWNRRFSLPWNTVVDAIRIFFTQRGSDGFAPPNAFWEDPTLIDLPFFGLAALLLLCGFWLTYKKLMPFSYMIFATIGLVFPLFSPAQRVPLLSFPRFALILFPLFIVLAHLSGRWRFLHHTYLFSAAMLLGVFLARFANWYWIS
jgi:hypothetical protein